MRLIRLTTDDDNGNFDSQFSTDIEIKKDQKIALQSASFQEIENTLILDNTNNNIQFDYDFDNTKEFTIELAEGTFDGSNFETLLNDITDKLNEKLPHEAGKVLGMQMKAQLNGDNKIQIGYLRDVLSTVDDRIARGEVSLNSTVQGVSANQFTVAKAQTEGDSIDDKCKYISNVPIGPGSKSFRVQLNHFTSNGGGTKNNGFRMGLTTVSPDAWRAKTTMTDAELGTYVEFVRAGVPYNVKSGPGIALQASAVTASAVADDSNDNDYIEFSIGDDTIKATIYSTNPNTTTTIINKIYTPSVQGAEYYPYISFQGSQTNLKLMKVRNHIDPFHQSQINVNHNSLSSKHGPELGANPPPAPVENPLTTNTMILDDAIAGFFGYNKSIFFLQGRNQVFFISEKIFTPTLQNVGFMIELNNIQIESYNSATGERQNIIASIPQNTAWDRAIVEYEANNLYFIDVNQDISLRNVKARILRIDGSQPSLLGTSVINLLID